MMRQQSLLIRQRPRAHWCIQAVTQVGVSLLSVILLWKFEKGIMT
jgi:hypothetical protein